MCVTMCADIFDLNRRTKVSDCRNKRHGSRAKYIYKTKRRKRIICSCPCQKHNVGSLLYSSISFSIILTTYHRHHPCAHIVHKKLCVIFECSCSMLIGARSTANECCSTFACDYHRK